MDQAVSVRCPFLLGKVSFAFGGFTTLCFTLCKEVQLEILNLKNVGYLNEILMKYKKLQNTLMSLVCCYMSLSNSQIQICIRIQTVPKTTFASPRSLLIQQAVWGAPLLALMESKDKTFTRVLGKIERTCAPLLVPMGFSPQALWDRVMDPEQNLKIRSPLILTSF